MGCGCGGSSRREGEPLVAAHGRDEGMFWNGPVRTDNAPQQPEPQQSTPEPAPAEQQ